MQGITAATILFSMILAGCSSEESEVSAGATEAPPAAEAAAGALRANDPVVLFEKGQKLIALNCHECSGATRERLLQGIEFVVESLERGYPDRAEAIKSLAAGYRTMVYYFGGGDHWAAKLSEAAEEAARLAPEDPEALIRYSDTLEPAERPDVLRRVLAVDPDNVEANFSLGMILLDGGETDAAIPHLLLVAEKAKGLDARAYLPAIELALRTAGRMDLADEIAARRSVGDEG